MRAAEVSANARNAWCASLSPRVGRSRARVHDLLRFVRNHATASWIARFMAEAASASRSSAVRPQAAGPDARTPGMTAQTHPRPVR